MTDQQKTSMRLSEQAIADAYLYLLGRLLIARQQQIDFDHEGMQWNTLLHRKPGQVDWPNPNLDVAYSEAWVALDEDSYLLIDVPRIEHRYYVVEFLNGWGETVANINERLYPDVTKGRFAVCLQGSRATVPAGAQRVDLPARVTRVLLRVELGANWEEAIALQHRFSFEMHGSPAEPPVPRTLMFDTDALPGVEAFDSALLALEEPDFSPLEDMQHAVRTIVAAIVDPVERARVDGIIRNAALKQFAAAAAIIGRGTIRQGWARPACCGHWGSDWLTRTTVNYGGIWANVFEEVLYYRGAIDSTGAPLVADGSYTLTFPASDLPEAYATYFWSVIAVDRAHRRVLPNALKRYLLNKESGLVKANDGSLTLYFSPVQPVDAPETNWLPTGGGKPWSLTFRFYGPRGGVIDGTYYPPPLVRRG
jgi:hypothetical protein